MHGNTAEFRLAIPAGPEAATAGDNSITDRAVVIMAGVWRRRFLPPHRAGNAKWDVFNDDHGDLCQPEPPGNLDGRRSVNGTKALGVATCILSGVRALLRSGGSGTQAATYSLTATGTSTPGATLAHTTNLTLAVE